MHFIHEWFQLKPRFAGRLTYYLDYMITVGGGNAKTELLTASMQWTVENDYPFGPEYEQSEHEFTYPLQDRLFSPTFIALL